MIDKIRKEKFKKYKGFSLVELLMAISIFTLVAASVSVFSIQALNYTNNNKKKNDVSFVLQEMNNGLILSKHDQWNNISDQTDLGPYSLQYINGRYQIVPGVTVNDGVSTSFTVESVYRDQNGEVVEVGGELDPYTRKVTVRAEWVDYLGETIVSNNSMLLNNWNIKKWIETTREEFLLGSGDYTYVRDIPYDDGEVELAKIFYPDWCNPTLSINQYDIPGSGTATTVFATDDHAYLGTAGSATGISVTKLYVEGVDPPVVTVGEEYDSYLVNNIFVKGDYAYLATTNDSKEVVILNITASPFVEVGNYNGGGSSDGQSVWVDDRGVGYLAQGRKVELFDVGYAAGNAGTAAANTGARTFMSSVNAVWLFGVVSEIVVRQTNVYAALNNDWYELGIVDASNPYSISITSQTTVNNQQVWDIYVSPDGTRSYFGTNSSSSEREFFILDTTPNAQGKVSGARSTIGSYDTNGMTVRGIAVVPQDNRVILVGTGAEEYQALDITNESLPASCGGMQVNSGIYDIDTAVDDDGNALSYLMTGDTSGEFKILRGGPGGGGGDGYGYVSSGDFVSAIHDTEAENPYYFSLTWTEDLPEGTDISIQVRTSETTSFAGVPWYGPSGQGTFYTDPMAGFPMDIDVHGKRYFQYRVFMTTSNPNVTPIFRDITLFYEGT